MKKRFQRILLCGCIIISTCLVGCSPKTTLDSEGSSILESMSSESETEQESSGVSTEPSESESDYLSNSETESESKNASESSGDSESETTSESESGSESESSESEEPSESESDSQEPSESESEATKPSEEPSESQKPSNEEPTEEEPSESESESKKPSDSYYTDVEFINEETTKYGTVLRRTITVTYAYYDDGRKVEQYRDIGGWGIYDASGYNATDNDLLPETLEVAKSNMSLYEEALKYTNEVRAKYREDFKVIYDEGTEFETILYPEPLTLSEDLCKAATMRAIEMYYANYFEHRRADDRGFWEFSCFDFAIDSENCHIGATTPSGAVSAWKNSQGHFENMMNTWTQVGFGYFNGYWVQIFD